MSVIAPYHQCIINKPKLIWFEDFLKKAKNSLSHFS